MIWLSMNQTEKSWGTGWESMFFVHVTNNLNNLLLITSLLQFINNLGECCLCFLNLL